MSGDMSDTPVSLIPPPAGYADWLAEQGWGAKVIERLAHDLRTAFDRSHAPAWERIVAAPATSPHRWSGASCVPTLERGNDRQLSAGA